jgi:hypothetical protein
MLNGTEGQSRSVLKLDVCQEMNYRSIDRNGIPIVEVLNSDEICKFVQFSMLYYYGIPSNTPSTCDPHSLFLHAESTNHANRENGKDILYGYVYYYPFEVPPGISFPIFF